MSARRPSSTRSPVIAGVDGSAAGQAAACLAGWEAYRRGCPLLLVHAIPAWHLAGRDEDARSLAAHRAAGELLRRAEVRVHARYPTVRVRTSAIVGSAAGGLVELSTDACLVVVGARGAGGFAGLSLGSVAAQVARHADAPVLVVHPATTGEVAEAPCEHLLRLGPVVVGVDGSAENAAALGFAMEEAAARAVPLTVIYAWWLLPPGNLGPTTPLRWDPAQALAQARRMLAEAVAGWSDKYPDVVITEVAEHSMNPAWTLIEASRDAGLLVVGSRGRGGFASLLLGSVSQSVLTHAACPVVIVRTGGER